MIRWQWSWLALPALLGTMFRATRSSNERGDVAHEYLTVDDLQDRYQIGRSLARDLIRRGVLPSIRVGRNVRVPRSEAERFEREQLEERAK